MYVSIRTTHELNEYALAALLWDAVHWDCDIEDSRDALTRAVAMPGHEVKNLIREALLHRGSDSVDCGPQNEWPTENVMETVRQKILMVYNK